LPSHGRKDAIQDSHVQTMPNTKCRILCKFLVSLLIAGLLVNCSGGGGDEVGVGNTDPHADAGSGNGGQQLSGTVISLENAKPGTTQWKLSDPALAHEIEGYASLTSVNKGDSIDFFVNTSAASYNIDIYRMGYYGGAGARLMQSFTNLAGQPQPIPCVNPDGVIECNWAVSLTLQIPDIETNPASTNYWASGVYLAKLTTNSSPAKDSYIIFVVRDDGRAATYVSQLPVTTYQAYNFWGGKSLYTGCEKPDDGWFCKNGARPAVTVSFNRPYGGGVNDASRHGVGAGEFLTNVQAARPAYNISNAAWDYNMVRWMEKQGYDLKYITNLDLHENSAILSQAKAFISTGHDEYYSKTMWDHLVQAKSDGINLAFFSANQIYWQVRFNDGAYGTSRKNRIMICYRGGGDPVTDNTLTTDQFRYLGRPEASLVGNQYVTDPIVGDVTITNAGHWLFAKSGAVNGTVLPGLLGYEINAYLPGVSPPKTRILAHSVADNYSSDITYYVDQSSAQVFSTGTMQWAWGLDNFIPNDLRSDYTSPIAQKMTSNLFAAIGEKNLSRLTLSGSQLDLSTPAGSLEEDQVQLSAPPASNAKTNLWRLVETKDDYYYLVSRANGLCLQALGANPGAQAVTRDCSGLDSQQWRLQDAGSGLSTLVEKSSGMCLVSSGASGEGSVSVDDCSKNRNRQWLRTSIS
jgi:hypothetical protein